MVSPAVCAVCGEPATELHHWAPRSVFGKEGAERWPRSWLCADHHLQWHNSINAGHLVAIDERWRKRFEAKDRVPYAVTTAADGMGGIVYAPLADSERCTEVKRKEHGIKRRRVSTWRCTLRVGHDGPHHVPGQAPWEV